MLIRGFITLVILLDLFFLQSAECAQEQADDQDFAPTFYGGRLNNDKLSGMLPQSRRNGKLRSLPNVKVKNFTQRLDHFDPSNQETWMQRYFVNDKYFNPGQNRTVFLIIGGEEASFDEYRLIDGPIVRLAEKYEAAVLGLEHRFYGESRPTKDARQKSLAFLNSRQALEDLNRFIKAQRKCKYPGAKVILYGCSYAGSLAAYFAALYPQSITGAISGYAPLLGVENFSAYFMGIAHAISEQYTGTSRYDCSFLVLQSVLGLNRLIETRDNERLQAMLNTCMTTPFSLCEPEIIDFDNPTAIDSIFYEFTADVMTRGQYNRPHLGQNSDLYLMCSTIQPSSSNCSTLCDKFSVHIEKFQCCQLERFARYLNATNQKCVRHDGKAMKCRSSGWDARYVASGTRQWLWQMCTEFGYFTTTEEAEDLKELKMRINLNYLKKGCVDSFNISYQEVKENVERTNSFYGAVLQKHPPVNVFFLTSQMDPWYKAHIKAIKSLEANVYGKGTEWRKYYERTLDRIPHCYEPTNDSFDPEGRVRGAWEKIDDAIQEWMKKV